jgi:dTDP-4-dehydrorhamnose reductase
MPRPTILLTGARGQIGFELARLLVPCGDVVATDRATLDLADPDAIVAAMRGAKPSLVINAGAYTAVDLAEKEAALARAVNGRAPGILAEEAKRLGAVLIHYSTDYVFDGTRGRNFLLTIRRLAAERDELAVVADQVGVPNWCRVIAEATARILESGSSAAAERAGLYHLSCGGHASWYEFARAIIGDTPNPRVVPIATSSYPTTARRPSYSVLATARFETTFGFGLPGWREGLARCLATSEERTG